MKRKRKTPEPAIKVLADKLEALSRAASVRYSILETKAGIAKLIYDNGASLESVAEKLGWPLGKLQSAFDPETDIDLRQLSDIATALGKQLHVGSVRRTPVFEESPEAGRGT